MPYCIDYVLDYIYRHGHVHVYVYVTSLICLVPFAEFDDADADDDDAEAEHQDAAHNDEELCDRDEPGAFATSVRNDRSQTVMYSTCIVAY